MSAACLGAAIPSCSSLALRRLVRHSFHPPLHVPKSSRLQSTLATAMLGRANKTFEARPPPRRNDLAKQLFPSSSPGASQNVSIVDSFRRPSQASAPAPSVPARIPNTTDFSNPQASYRAASSMASLYSQSGSFGEEPVNISRVEASQPKPLVFFNEDDFSDDDNLDFQQPTALPTLPKPPPPAAPQNLLPPTQSETAIPWSSSPASHMVPPLSRSTSRTVSNTGSLKRMPEDQFETPQQPALKKRSLPPSWGRKGNPIDLDDENHEGIVAPLDPRKLSRQDSLPWNTTASAVKAQKKQLKSQVKKPEEEVTKMSMEVESVISSQVATSPKDISLSSEQQRILDLVVNKGQSVFFTGPAGTGKSFLMGSIISSFKKKFLRDPERLAVTASTGLAACNIGGVTLHSFAGIGLGKDPVPQLVKKIRQNPKAKNRWLKTKVLIIDEISMVDGDLFDKLSHIGRTMRNNGRPWGGIQLVITGDFFQLPPVPDSGNDSKKRESKFAFDAGTWNTSIDHTIGLTQVFRQKDPVFANMLNEMRVGRISDKTVAAFKQMARPIPSQGANQVGTTELFSTRHEVENANNSRLRSLQGKAMRFEALDTGDPQRKDKLLQHMMAPKSLELKVGAQVMLVKNMDDTLVNGSVGKVKGFSTEEIFEIKGNLRFDDDDGSGGKMSKVKGRMQAFTKEWEQKQHGAKEYPVVEFAATDDTYRTILCVPEEWKVELPTGEVEASRTQVPLILAWALSIHKAQGQTLERVKVDLGRAFEKGQAYVALSRATTQQGLQVLRFEKHRVMAHPRVIQFYDRLSTIEQAVAKKPVSVATFAQAKHKPSVEASRMAAFVVRQTAVDGVDGDKKPTTMPAYG